MASRKIVSDITQSFVVILSLLFILYPDNLVIASSLTYQRDYTYQASEADSKLSCRTIALEQVKRLLLEELGTYLKSNTEVKDFQVSRDQVIAMTAGIVGVAIINEKWDGQTYYISAKVSADPKQVAKAIKELQEEPGNLREVEILRNQTDEIMKELKMLREELKTSKEGQKTRATEDYNEAVKKLSLSDWYKEGLVLVKSGKYRDAIGFYNKAIDANPTYFEAYTARGWAYHKIGDYPSALKDTNRALSLKPNSPGVLVNRSEMLWRMKQFDKALVDANRAIELKPDFERAYYIRAVVYLFMGNNSNAIEDFNKAIELNPNYANAYFNRGAAYRNSGRYEEALKDFQKSIEINPEIPDIYNNRGYAYLLMKKYDEALQDLNKALELNENPATPLFSPAIVLYRRGLTYNQLKEYNGAIRDFSKVIEYEKNNAAAYYNRAHSNKQIGKNDEALSDLKKAAQLGDVRAQKAINK